ncbi:MAG: sigma 54-interacting transcriptional regulator [Clostridia bacterium]|jgi:PAS domain S-box-containing protein|nr:sigma 54-interacting transcriptional regulator [Clostridia bacterium]
MNIPFLKGMMSMNDNTLVLKQELLIYRRIMDVSTDGFIVVDKNAYIIDINQAYCNYLDVKREEVLGKYVRDVIKNSSMPEIVRTGQGDTNTIHAYMGDQVRGKEKIVAVTRSAVLDGNEIIGAVSQIKFSNEMMDLAQKIQALGAELQYYKKELKRIGVTRHSFENMIGKNPRFLEIKNMAKKVAGKDLSLLILGETGSGKEVFANAIHYASQRRDGPFIRVNCAAIPSELLESELFGYEEGSFTGARRGGKKGKFELANGGTIFLDEIGDMPLNMQAKILRVLQENELEKVGGSEIIPLNIRVIAATNQDLEQKMRNNTFRSDLYYRLNVIQFEIPPLRQRPEDVQDFINSFLAELNERYDTNVILAPEVLQMLLKYNWPGNIREVKNIVERAYSLVEGNVIKLNSLPSAVFEGREVQISPKKGNLDDIIENVERDTLLRIIQKNNYNCKMTARELGIHRSTLYKKLNKLNIIIDRK